jgi:tetratricopeptide (TPR) repeat protein
MTTAIQFFQLGKFEDAEFILVNILKNQPKNFDALHTLGVVKGIKSQHREALELFNKALKIDAGNSFLHFNIAKAFSDIGEDHKALKYHLNATKLNPSDQQGWLNYGISLLNLDRVNEALDIFNKAIELNSQYAEAWTNRVVALQKLQLYEEALLSLDEALRINPLLAEAHSNRGNVLKDLQRIEESLACYDRAIEISPDYADAHYNRGIALFELKLSEEAMACYEKAIEVMPDFPKAHFMKSLYLLMVGQFDQGWKLYEWRWKNENNGKPEFKNRTFSQPLWLGADDLAGKTILLHAEQGLGDTIQFCRYAKLVKERGARLLLEVPKALLGLLSGLEGVDQFVEKGKALPSFDYHCPLLSLPLAFNTTLASIPNKIPYIHLNINNQNKWQERIGGLGFKVAICWQGSTKGKVDVGRSFPVSLFEGLAQIDGVRLISIQKNEGVEQLKNLPVGMIVETLPDDFDSGENAFLDSAAVMKCMDLVITSDTALTHLAGALGVKTWLPLKYVPDWRWMLDRSDSPWYPNHRLFRQQTSDDWISVFTEMEKELKSLVSTKSASKQ